MSDARRSSLTAILPVGTAVVALVEIRAAHGGPVHQRGVAGVIEASPVDVEHCYRVRFPGGDVVSLKRREIQVLSHFQEEAVLQRIDPIAEHDLSRHVIYRCVVGSRAYGLDHDGSDVDRRGIYLPPASMHWSIYGLPEQLENTETEECYWELEKFIKLALKANPNVLETLYTPLVEHADPIAIKLREMRSSFLSRLVFQTFNGYAISQFDKINRTLAKSARVKWKHAMHLIRLLRSGIEALRTGELPVRVLEHRDELMRIRDGQMAWEEIEQLRLRLHAEFEGAYAITKLPERPDYERANALLIEARQTMAAREFPR